MGAPPRRDPQWRRRWPVAAMTLGCLTLGCLTLGCLTLGCSEPSPPGSEGGSSPGGGGAAGAPAVGGSEGGEAPKIESLTSDVILITELPTTVVFSAVVSDPQGEEDIAGGTLSSGAYLGDFVATGAPGGYQLELTVDESLGWSEQGYRVLMATFTDHAGHLAEGSTGIELDIGGCSVAPSHEACRACFCRADPAGCASYTAFEHEHLRCGNSCSGACDVFCQSLAGGTADRQLIDADCAACEPSNDDLAAFEQACLNDIPDCFGFLVDVGQCPAR